MTVTTSAEIHESPKIQTKSQSEIRQSKIRAGNSPMVASQKCLIVGFYRFVLKVIATEDDSDNVDQKSQT